MTRRCPTALQGLLDDLRKRHVAPAIIARVERLNPTYDWGELPRGLNRKTRSFHRYAQTAIGKRAFIAQYGRAAWDGLRRQHRLRDGRRQHATLHAVQDRAWEVWNGQSRREIVVVAEPDAFANDLSARLFAWRYDEFCRRFGVEAVHAEAWDGQAGRQ